MNYIVVPLSAAAHGGAKDPLWVALSIVVHAVLIGIPIALLTRRALLAPRLDRGFRVTGGDDGPSRVEYLPCLRHASSAGSRRKPRPISDHAAAVLAACPTISCARPPSDSRSCRWSRRRSGSWAPRSGHLALYFATPGRPARHRFPVHRRDRDVRFHHVASALYLFLRTTSRSPPSCSTWVWPNGAHGGGSRCDDPLGPAPARRDSDARR